MNTNNRTEILNVSHPSIKEIRKKIIDSIISMIGDSGISLKLDHFELYLIIDEALTNAMEHGNHWDPEKMVTIRVEKDWERLFISIKDEGIGFNTDLVNSKLQTARNLNPRGRGIYIIRQFCGVKWNKIGNQIQLQIELKK